MTNHKRHRGRPRLNHASTYIGVPIDVLRRWKAEARRNRRPLGLWIVDQIEQGHHDRATDPASGSSSYPTSSSDCNGRRGRSA